IADAGPATPAASCSGPREATASTSGDARFAQTFAPSTNGSVTSAEADVTKAPGSSGDWTMSIVADYTHPVRGDAGPLPVRGTAFREVLATTRISDSEVPVGDSTLHGAFSDPPAVKASGTFYRAYRLTISRPGASSIGIGYRSGNDCAGILFESDSQTAPFNTFVDAGTDMVFAVDVSDITPPATRIRRHPPRRTQRRHLTLLLGAGEPGASFECSVDGAAFEPCHRRARVKAGPGPPPLP